MSLKEISWNEALELASPYPYTLVTTVSKKGNPNIIGLSWWTITSWAPQLIAISIGHSRYSHECIEYCREFVLCFPSEEQKEAAWRCGNISGRKTDKFKETGLTPLPAKHVKPPLIDGVTVAYECKVIDKIETGDHALYIGEVVAIHGLPQKVKHLFSISYDKLVSLDCKGNVNFD